MSSFSVSESQCTVRAPKILYHGTTMLRWTMIKKDGLLRCNMPKSFEAEEYFSSGHVYLTSDLHDAIIYGFVKSVLDMDSDYEQWMKLNPDSRDPVVLGINTSELKNLEIFDGINTTLVKLTVPKSENSQLYKHGGSIKLKHLFLYRYVPFSDFDNDEINQIKKRQKEKESFYRSAVMNRLASQSILTQLSFPLRNMRVL